MKNAICIGILIVFFSCIRNIEPETPDKLFENYKGSVVLITNQFYYEIENNDKIFYFSPNSEDKLYYSEEDVLENLSIMTGTGFIISKDGEIITNRHVVNPINKYDKEELNNYRISQIELFNEIDDKYKDSLSLIKVYYNDNILTLTQEEKDELQEEYTRLYDFRELFSKIKNIFSDLDVENASFRTVNHRIAIAYNNTHVTNFNDLQECVLIKESTNENVDLALIQTKTKNFNNQPNRIFNFLDNNPNLSKSSNRYSNRNLKNPIAINEDVYMIGFNRGFSLANTKQGIKSQFTSGKISQESDGERILYTIPTLEGSSGSPIIDKWGNLVAVNFAKVNNSQSFSFGIPVFEVKKFIEE